MISHKEPMKNIRLKNLVIMFTVVILVVGGAYTFLRARSSPTPEDSTLAANSEISTTTSTSNPDLNVATTTAIEYRNGSIVFRVTSKINKNGDFLGTFLEAFQNGKKVFTIHDADDYYALGFPCPQSDTKKICDPNSSPTFGVDINGDGNKDFIIDYVSMGSDAENDYHIFELPAGGTLRALTSIDTYGGAVFKDLDHDGRLEAQFNDGKTWSCWQTGCAEAPAPQVILSWDGVKQAYAPNQKLMRRPAPSSNAIAEQASHFKDNPAYWETTQYDAAYGTTTSAVAPQDYAVDLIYSGNAVSAQKYIDLVWPLIANQSGLGASKANFESQLLSQLQQSPYYEAVLSLNGGKIF
jgi:hypothetical protein